MSLKRAHDRSTLKIEQRAGRRDMCCQCNSRHCLSIKEMLCIRRLELFETGRTRQALTIVLDALREGTKAVCWPGP